MEIIKSEADVETYIKEQKILNKKICLIPTMGSLHDGHLELIKKAPTESSKIVSIYVNDLQFDDKNDYINYPKNTDKDIDLCKKNNVDSVFIPNKEYLINLMDETSVDLPKFTRYMCGATRHGHFLGVYKIVKVLFNIFNPDHACFGKKDYQQLLLIKYLAKTHFQNLKIIDVDIIRNNNIALSSRLRRLSKTSLIKAKLIYETLLKSKNNLLKGDNFTIVKNNLIDKLNSNGIQIEYIELRSLDTLEESKNSLNKSGIFIACYIDDIRLIDNIEI